MAATTAKLSSVCLFKYIRGVEYSQSDGGSDSPLCQLTEFGYWISFRGTGPVCLPNNLILIGFAVQPVGVVSSAPRAL